MTEGPLLAELGALVGDPARASMLAALLDGRALTAGELAYVARITPQTASAHLARLAEARLVTRIKSGRHHYVRLASPKVAALIEGLMSFAIDGRPRFRPLSREAAALRAARLCYDHLAGRLGVALADALEREGHVLLDAEGGRITREGARFLAGFGIALDAASERRRLCRSCLDWTERRFHVGGALGAALAERCFALHWTERAARGRFIRITPLGERGFAETFGIALGGREAA